MNRFALEIDEELCWGCKTCEVACKQEHATPTGVQLIRVGEDGPRRVDEKWHYTFTVNRCRHCDSPPCVDVCPEGAIEEREDGVVVLIEGACSGCRLCLPACPYDAIDFDEAGGVARKCNLCHKRVDQGLLPACADNVCLAHCIRFSVERSA